MPTGGSPACWRSDRAAPPVIRFRTPGLAETAQRLRDDPISGRPEGQLLTLRVRLQDLQFIVAQHRYDAIDSRVLRRARSGAQRSARASSAPTPAGLLFSYGFLLSCGLLLGGFLSYGHDMHHVLQVVLRGTSEQIRSAPMDRYQNNILLDFLIMGSPATQKFGLSMQFSEKPHTFTLLFP